MPVKYVWRPGLQFLSDKKSPESREHYNLLKSRNKISDMTINLLNSLQYGFFRRTLRHLARTLSIRTISDTQDLARVLIAGRVQSETIIWVWISTETALPWTLPGTADRLHPRPDGCNIPSWPWVFVNSKVSVPYMDEVENRFDHFVAEVFRAHTLLASAIPMTGLNREILSSLALWDVQGFAIPPKVYRDVQLHFPAENSPFPYTIF